MNTSILPEIKNICQPDGITCGPTCIKMVANRYGCGKGLTVQAIGDMAGTNHTTGTTDKEMHRGLTAIGLSYQEYLPANPEILKNGFEQQSVFIVRTIINGMKHWILAVDINENQTYTIQDPAGGTYTLTLQELNKICAPRNWQMFEIYAEQDKNNFLSQKILGNNWAPAIYIGEDAFEHVSERHTIKYHLQQADRSISPTLWIGKTMIGVYFLERRALFHFQNNETLQNVKAIEGIGLAVNKNYRGRGYGSLLRAWPSRMGVDYVWGSQLRTLNNIEDWKKRREIYGEGPVGFITVEIVTRLGKIALKKAMQQNAERDALSRKEEQEKKEKEAFFT